MYLFMIKLNHFFKQKTCLLLTHLDLHLSNPLILNYINIFFHINFLQDSFFNDNFKSNFYLSVLHPDPFECILPFSKREIARKDSKCKRSFSMAIYGYSLETAVIVAEVTYYVNLVNWTNLRKVFIGQHKFIKSFSYSHFNFSAHELIIIQ